MSHHHHLGSKTYTFNHSFAVGHAEVEECLHQMQLWRHHVETVRTGTGCDWALCDLSYTFMTQMEVVKCENNMKQV